jgi:hypothetical protein
MELVLPAEKITATFPNIELLGSKVSIRCIANTPERSLKQIIKTPKDAKQKDFSL